MKEMSSWSYCYLLYGAYLKIKICTPNSPFCMVILLLVVCSLFEDQNLYFKIVLFVWKYCCLLYKAYLKIKICSPNSPLHTVIRLLGVWNLFEEQNLYTK
jgi:hypothetical protein